MNVLRRSELVDRLRRLNHPPADRELADNDLFDSFWSQKRTQEEEGGQNYRQVLKAEVRCYFLIRALVVRTSMALYNFFFFHFLFFNCSKPEHLNESDVVESLGRRLNNQNNLRCYDNWGIMS